MPHTLAIFTDFPEEGWRSMDLCAEMLIEHLPREGQYALTPTRICPRFRRLALSLPVIGRRQTALNADRVFNRFVLFPYHARRVARKFDLFHVADHSYAQLVHSLPAGQTGVYCHDVDAFRSLIDPEGHQRPGWFRTMSRQILGGLRKAAVVFHNTEAVAAEIKFAGLIDPDRLVHAPLGVAPEFTREAPGSLEIPAWLAELEGRPWVLHVGTAVNRKRIDVLLDVVAAVRTQIPDLHLLKVGGELTTKHREQIARLDLSRSLTHVSGLTREILAEVYRRAPLVLIPSDAEGFGLPVVEALACGAPVVASDIPALREAGGTAALFAPVADIDAWSDLISKLFADPTIAPAASQRLEWSARFTWSAHAETIASAYHKLLRC